MYSVHVTRRDYCDYECLIFRGTLLIAEAQCSSRVAAVRSAHGFARMRRKYPTSVWGGRWL